MADFVTPTIRTFQVFPDLPPALAPLLELAKNFWWMWHPDAVDLFRRLDRDLWEQVYHNPVKLLGAIDQQKLMAASKELIPLWRGSELNPPSAGDLNKKAEAFWFKLEADINALLGPPDVRRPHGDLVQPHGPPPRCR